MDTTISRYVIEADHFAVGYGERTILHDITTKIERGSVTCICGGSGCGKSTFLRSTIGLVPHKGGSVRVLGEDVNALDEAEKAQFLSRVGFMYQNGGLINSLTVLDNLKIPLMAHTQLPDDVIEELVYHKLSQVQLTHAVHLLPGELSGGMLKRAGFARAMILEPELVLSDEPSAGARSGDGRRPRCAHGQAQRRAWHDAHRRHARPRQHSAHCRPHRHARQGICQIRRSACRCIAIPASAC